MCEFCHKHGEGKKWYLQAKNYSGDLLSDARRRKMIEGFAATGPDALQKTVRKIDGFSRQPALIRQVLTRLLTRRMKRRHYGQVVPIEEIEQIFGFTNSISRVACLCRKATCGREARFCYGISLSPNGGKFAEILRGVDNTYLDGPDTSAVENLTKEEAIAAFREHERQGLCHTVWTFCTPFIAGVCNCDRTDCLAMRATVTQRLPVMFRAEYVAEVNPDACVGCRQCMRLCQFGAITYSPATEKAVIDKRWCYGCGICRSACKKDAIGLKDRTADPAIANLW